MGKKLARKIGAAKYLECSCFNGKDLEKVFEEAVWASLRFPKPGIQRLLIAVDGKDLVGKTLLIRQFETGEACEKRAITIGTACTIKKIIIEQREYLLKILQR